VNGQDTTGTPSEGARITVIDPKAPPESRFGPTERGSLGNAGRNILRHPGFINFDVSAYRTIKFSDTVRAQLRFESYNTPNSTQFSTVSATARFNSAADPIQIDPLFLEPTAARGARRVQLALRLNW
jgi:hypothetical protein